MGLRQMAVNSKSKGSPAAVHRPESYKWVALTNTTIGILMATIDASIVLISLPAIFRGININPLAPGNTSYLLWMLMGYMVITAVLVVTFGRVGDMFGRVKMYNLGFAIFTVGSLAASLTYFHGPGAALYLISMRIVQGVGGAMVMANSTAILTDAFPENQRGMALGINSVAGIAGSFIGLVAGGLLATIDWHLIFYVSVPIGLFGTIWAYLKLEEVQTGEGGRLDLAGNVLFAVGLVAVLVGITYALQPYGGSSMGWLSPLVLTLLIGGVVMLAVFVLVENKVAQPMFDMGLFRIRAFAAGNIAGLLASIGRGGMMFMLIIWLQGIWLPLHGYNFVDTPLWAGIYMLPLTAGFLVAGPASGYLSDRFGARPFATGGMIAAAATFGLLTLLPVNFNYVWFALLLAANGLSMGLFASPNTAGIMNAVPPNRRGVSSGMRSTFQNAGMTLSIGLFFTIMVVGLSSSMPSTLMHGLMAQGVPSSDASRIASLPPVSILFAAFLGYNPMKSLLGSTLSKLSPSHQAVLTGHDFFSNLVSGPFHNGLEVVFTFALIMCVVAAGASWLRGSMVSNASVSLPSSESSMFIGPDDPEHEMAGSAHAGIHDKDLKQIVTISASFGSGGAEIGPLVAKRLGLPFFDRAIPLQVAQDLGISSEDAILHDEHIQGAALRSLVNLIGASVSFGLGGIETKSVDDEDSYRRATEKVLWDLASGSGGVVLGRAAAVVLAQAPNALHVRLDGSEEARVRNAMQHLGIDEDSARRKLKQTDAMRSSYVKRLYGVDPSESALYSLVIDTTVIPWEKAVDVIVDAAARKDSNDANR